MAIIKHVSSKNASYSNVVDYLKYEHDEKTGDIIVDENGGKIERQNIIASSINCNSDTWAIECLEVNRKYSKNQSQKDVKNHSYIISFSPADRDRGLTPTKAHELGEEFAKKNLSGYQTIIYTHDDGHNNSGNIHVHIVINSVRIKEMEKRDYMTKKCDYAEGFKHRDTGKFRYHYANEIMKICNRENLHQVDLNKSKSGVTEKEYYAKKRGQEKETLLATKEKRKPTQFDTDKEELRQVVKEARINTADIIDNKEREQALIKYAKVNYDVEIKETRGRWSYKHPSWDGTNDKRSRPISDKKLGDEYRRENIIQYGSDKQNERIDSNRNSRGTGEFKRNIETQIRDRSVKGIESDIKRREREFDGIEKQDTGNNGRKSKFDAGKSKATKQRDRS